MFPLFLLLFQPAATETLHGVKITDPYRWLEDQNSPRTRAWVEGQNKRARAYLDALPGREFVLGRCRALMKIDQMSVPVEQGGRYFFTRRRAAENRPSIYMRTGVDGRDELLVDPANVDKNDNTTVFIRGVSRDGVLLAYGVRRGGQDEAELRILNVATRKLLPDTLPRGRYFGFSITGDNAGFYYSRFTSGVGSRVYYHRMGSAQDKLIFGEGYGPRQIVSVSLSEDRRYLLVRVAEGVPPRKLELYIQDLEGGGPLRPVVNDVEADFRADFAGRWLYLATNWNAPNWRVLRVDLEHPARANWKEVVPERKQAIEYISAACGRLYVTYLEDVKSRVRQFTPEGRELGDFPLPGTGSVSGPSGHWDKHELFFGYTSFTEPFTTYRVSPDGARQVWFRPEVPIRGGDFEVRQVWYESKDKTRVPMFLVHRKGLQPNGNVPVLLYGYGGFTASGTPAFNPAAATWAAAGGVYALANLRGGGEFGEAWHRAGMFEKKQNVFDDFIAAAEWLIRNRYTTPERLGIMGTSNGGLLMGAMLTQRPDLFGAVVCRYPLLDMLRYHKMMVGSWWTSEYGSADDPNQFRYLYKYSPYHNVRKGTKYPATLFVSGDGDTRVDPAHARKMAALMQAANRSGDPILLRYDLAAGHSGTGSVDRSIDVLADEIGFLAAQLGLRFR